MAGLRICRAWITNPDPNHGSMYGPAIRLVCTRRPHSRLVAHQTLRTGWRWWPIGPSTLHRDWTCQGILHPGDPYDANAQPIRCGTTARLSSNAARAAGWRLHHFHSDGHWQWDAMCPTCGQPDPVTAGYVRDLERSVAHRG